MELKFKKNEFVYDCTLEKLSDMQNYVDPSWRKFGISNYWYKKITLKNDQIIYVLDKKTFEIGKGFNQIRPVKITIHKTGDITIKCNNIKDCVSVMICY